MPLQATAGAATYDAFGGGPATTAKYVEDYFQTWLRTGTGASATVTTGINASLNKSLVWTKSRSAATDHKLTDTVRGATKGLISNTTGAETTDTNGLTAFSSTGYTIGTDTNYNTNGATYVDWQWAATPKFFDVVTYTGNGSNRTISHSLGSVPGCIIVKRTDTTADWQVYHRSLANTEYMVLNTTAAKATGTTRWNSTTPTATEFSLGTDTTVNANTGTYVAYLFAHDAGGFGAAGTDNVISCGSFTTDGSGNATVTLGWEPQWVMIKPYSGAGFPWLIYDSMRGWTADQNNAALSANTSDAEQGGASGNSWFRVNSTGFNPTGAWASTSYIYIAIRRGPMRTPTSGTSVFTPVTSTSVASGTSTAATNFPVDLNLCAQTTKLSGNVNFDSAITFTRLTGNGATLKTASTSSEGSTSNGVLFDSNTTCNIQYWGFNLNVSGYPQISWNFRRAPGFFDVVCYTGTGSATTFSHNLGVVPEMMIVKRRDTTADWWVYDVATGNTKYQVLNSTATPTTSSTAWNNTTPTSSVFTVGTGTPVNASAGTYVAYLFATVAGVSKVFSYTGNGSSQTINCGFTAGTRFVLIKRTDSTGDWYVWDSARGIVASNDPHLSLNTTAAEVTTDDSVDTDNTGFVVNQVAATNVNVSSATYIGLAIA